MLRRGVGHFDYSPRARKKPSFNTTCKLTVFFVVCISFVCSEHKNECRLQNMNFHIGDFSAKNTVSCNYNAVSL